MPKVKRDEDELSVIERKLINCYEGRGTLEKAADAVGITYVYARELIRKPQVLRFLHNKNGMLIEELEAKQKNLIAGKAERLMRLTQQMRDPEEEPKVQQKAIELLGKMAGDFQEKVIHEGGDKPIEMVSTIKEEDIQSRLERLLPEAGKGQEKAESENRRIGVSATKPEKKKEVKKIEKKKVERPEVSKLREKITKAIKERGKGR